MRNKRLLVRVVGDDSAKPLVYKVYYNKKLYQSYEKAESSWSILYDYSYEDVTDVTIRRYENWQAKKAVDETTFTIATIEDDTMPRRMSRVTHFATRYPLDLRDLSKYAETLESLELQGPAIEGRLEDLLPLRKLEALRLDGCTGVRGAVSDLDSLKLLARIRADGCPDVLDDRMFLETDVRHSRIIIHTGNDDGETLFYRVYYDKNLYQSYEKSESSWPILYDFSNRATTEITVRQYRGGYGSQPSSERVFILAKSLDRKKNRVLGGATHFATRYPLELRDLDLYAGTLESVEFQGSAVRGRMADLGTYSWLKTAGFWDCDGLIVGPGDLEELERYASVRAEGCPGIAEGAAPVSKP